ncbi:hypothetical protein [Desulfitobacterium sp. AusDCA]|uniref:hypothetical protein n=1 Tax=Desulfitobacterium sp. AusDCA TaxID=3240383 RepID=UPI003DA76672
MSLVDPNVIRDSLLNGMFKGAIMFISSVPWWLWVLVVVTAVLKIFPSSKSRR